MVRYIGLDVHRREVEVCILAPDGTVVHRDRVACTREALEAFARAFLQPEDQAVLEASGPCWSVRRVLAPFVARIVASNCLLTRAIASAKIKTDKIDAGTLANLLRCGYLPEVWAPDTQTLELRSLTAKRAALVGECVRCKNRIRAVLAQALLPRYDHDLFSATGREYLEGCALSPNQRHLVNMDLRLLDSTLQEMASLDSLLAPAAYADPQVLLLMTLPGVDYDTALTVKAALGDVSRFEDGNHLAAYLGLVPSTHQSGQHCYHGPITKRGNSKARWMLIQSCQRMDVNEGPLGHFFRRLARKKNRNVAVVATARKLAVIAWHMLTNNEPYRYALPRPTRAKLCALRVKATGERRPRGVSKGTPRSENYGTGQGVIRTPSLPEVCQTEGLPSNHDFDELPEGERKMLTELGLIDYVDRLQRPQTRPLPKPGVGRGRGGKRKDQAEALSPPLKDRD